MAQNLVRAPLRALVPAALSLLAGCALTHLDLDGGAALTAVIPDGDPMLTLAIDDSRSLALTLIYDDGFQEVAPADSVAWSIDDPTIAAIDGDTRVRGRAIGAAQLTARYQNQTASQALTVVDLPQAIEVQAGDRNCVVGEQLAYAALLRYQHGATELITTRAAWTTNQAAIATVAAGVITCVAVGDTRINATLGTVTNSADVHVTAALAPGVQ